MKAIEWPTAGIDLLIPDTDVNTARHKEQQQAFLCVNDGNYIIW